MCYYQSVEPPVLEYACPCCHLHSFKMFNVVRFRSFSVIYRRPIMKYVVHNILSLGERRLEFSRTFHRGSSETSRTSFVIFYQPSVIFSLQLDCVVLDNIQQSMHELIHIKTLSLYMDYWQ